MSPRLAWRLQNPEVVKANNLKALAEDVFMAIRIVNEEGGMRRDNVPEACSQGSTSSVVWQERPGKPTI